MLLLLLSGETRGKPVYASRWFCVVAAAAVMTLSLSAEAQKAPEKAEPKAPAAKAEKAEKKVKPKSACNALTEEKACTDNASCQWIKALVDKGTGKQKRKAYCRTKSKTAAKKKTSEPAKK
jgi:hypothetical protein